MPRTYPPKSNRTLPVALWTEDETRIKKLKKHLNQHSEAAVIRDALRIAVVHYKV